MATTSIADKLAKLEKKIAKRQATIAEEQKQLDKGNGGVQQALPDGTCQQVQAERQRPVLRY